MVKWRKDFPEIDGYYWLWPKGYWPEIVLVQTDPFSDEQKYIVWDIGGAEPHKFQEGLQYLWLPITEPLHTDEEWENAE